VSGPLFEQYKAALRRGHLAAVADGLEDALEAYREAARLVPDRSLPLASQGTVLHRLDRWPEAADAFDRALRLSPDDELALRARGSALEERGLRAEAAADFERLAFVLDVAGHADRAAQAARRATALDPSPARDALALRLAAAAAPLGASDAVASDGDAGGAPDKAGDAPADQQAEAWPGLAEERLLGAIAALDELPQHATPADGASWPAIDLPSTPQHIVGPPPDAETVMANATALLDAGDTSAARDLMLMAAMVHRDAGRLDAALDICLQLLSMEPGDAQVHLSIANLQLDNGWTALATEKIELLRRLTALTGDTQAEADVRGLAAERL
jgi:tetratricopeptide (TPR) repeat protein